MVTYGLDTDIAHRVVHTDDFSFVTSFSGEITRPIRFTNYALIGLQNYFISNPEMFLSRLSKGPPPQYRWLAWKFIGLKVNKKVPGEYYQWLQLGRKDDN